MRFRVIIWLSILFAPSLALAQSHAGSEACASCHRAIFDSYSKTPMANASGPAIDQLIPGEFTHQKSGVKYRVYQQDGKAWLSFERLSDPAMKGRRELLYYIGSNRVGRSYLFQTDGFLFETPINWYAQKKLWDMAPAYQDAREMPLNLPAVSDCLNCHTSGMHTPAAGTENRYGNPPVAHGGVTCQRCHGDDLAHASGKSQTVNPLKLASEKRDAICMQCHLEGTVAITLPGKHLYDFRPGDDLMQYIRYFVLQNKQSERDPALSQVEALAQSVCKQKSGDRMSCTSCHDPHRTPAAAERVAFYRGKCLTCHGEAFGKKHHVDQPDCTSCHMPFKMGTTVAHTQATDHRILRNPSQVQLADASQRPDVPKLVPFPDTPETRNSPREFALAWQSLAESGMSDAERDAAKLLKKDAAKSDDPDLLAALAYIEQRSGDQEAASEMYERALKKDPLRLDAAMNLGVIRAKGGHLAEAVKLWQPAFERAPYRSAIGMNLAGAFCAAGQYKEARDYVKRVLEFNPDLGSAKRVLVHLDAEKPGCGM